ncbi:hypothetical protein L917_14575 [Phytophthora nicotianae]|uniref:Uncharacterized protein n=1 Tax=Phytophthora nicotianae TaxID=4792 RepID=W2KLL2_PHYNI|nr:hypothetical protein L917_14575 [Phytophthora nicotianae]
MDLQQTSVRKYDNHTKKSGEHNNPSPTKRQKQNHHTALLIAQLSVLEAATRTKVLLRNRRAGVPQPHDKASQFQTCTQRNGGAQCLPAPPESFLAGDVVEYYSQGYVCGDRRGHRIAVVLKIVSTDDNPFPVSLDTQEPLPLIAMVRRRFDGVGSELPIDRVRWRKLRSYKLVTGIHDAPTTADSLGAAVKAAIHEA